MPELVIVCQRDGEQRSLLTNKFVAVIISPSLLLIGAHLLIQVSFTTC
ncbi:hypothetical protein [Aurantivibrio infirmus]